MITGGTGGSRIRISQGGAVLTGKQKNHIGIGVQTECVLPIFGLAHVQCPTW